MKKRRKVPRLAKALLVIVALVLAALAYRLAYYRTTTLTVDKPCLDWYAYREFASRGHFYIFLPMYYIEHNRALRDPGYCLTPTIAEKK